MKAEYDLSKMKSRPNPYAKRLKRQVTIRLGKDVIGYFKQMWRQEPASLYQTLIDLYLRDRRHITPQARVPAGIVTADQSRGPVQRGVRMVAFLRRSSIARSFRSGAFNEETGTIL